MTNVKPIQIYELEQYGDEIFAIELQQGEGNNWILLCQPPYGNYPKFHEAFEAWQEWGMEIREIDRTVLDFTVDDLPHISEDF